MADTRRTRRNLSIMMVVVAIMIVVFYNLPGSRRSGEVRTGPMIVPTEQTAAQQAAGNNQLTSPALIEAAPLKSHNVHIQSWQTPKGAKVLFVNAPEIPMLDVRVVFNAGSARDSDLPGLAFLTNAMLKEGAGVSDVDDIARHFEGLGASLDTGAYRDMAIVSLRTLSDDQYRRPALTLFNDIVAHPTFPVTSLDRLRNQLLLGLQREKQDPGAQVAKAFFAELYPAAPYGIPTRGTEDSLPLITQDRLQAFHRQYYVAGNAVIAMIGAVDRTEAELIALQLDQQLPAGPAAPRLQATTGPDSSRREHIEFPSTQTHIMAGTIGVKRGDASWYPLLVGNEILGGGGFASRLNQVIRQDNGLAYSVYSQFVPMAVEGPFLMGLQTRNDQSDKALDLLDKTLRDFISKGPSAQELADAKRNLLGSFPLQTASNSSIVDYLGMIGFYNLPLNYLEQYPKAVEAVTIDDVKQAFSQVVHPDKLLTVTVGSTATAATN
ncbi:MAG: pitrilysin family protein [Gammaproteobacteria bacterium]